LRKSATAQIVLVLVVVLVLEISALG